MIINRRKLLGRIGLAIAAPAIIKVADIMPVKAWVPPDPWAWAAEGDGVMLTATEITEAEINVIADEIMKRRTFARVPAAMWPGVKRWWWNEELGRMETKNLTFEMLYGGPFDDSMGGLS